MQELRRSFPPRHKQGVTIFFTGLSGSGKSTIANVLMTKFLEIGGRPVTILDGDLVRKHLSSELGFSKEHRDINIRRIGYVASEITKNGGIAICAPIAPYDATRKAVRGMVEPGGGFILVHVSTGIDVCEQRDRKGLYAKARAGILKEFTGISDPYEEPKDAEVVIDTANLSPRKQRRRSCCTWNGKGSSAPSENAHNRVGTTVPGCPLGAKLRRFSLRSLRNPWRTLRLKILTAKCARKSCKGREEQQRLTHGSFQRNAATDSVGAGIRPPGLSRFTPGEIEAEYRAAADPVTEADTAIDALLRGNCCAEAKAGSRKKPWTISRASKRGASGSLILWTARANLLQASPSSAFQSRWSKMEFR